MSPRLAGPDPRPSSRDLDRGGRLLLVVILAAAATLRVWNIGGGIPDAVGVDEPQIMERVVRMMKTGDFNPHFFDWPSLTFYLQLVVACFTFLSGAMAGKWSHLDHVSAADFYFNGRLLTAALGTATVWLVYRAGLRWGRTQALLAAALLAVVPYHVRESHFVLTDVPAGLLTTLVLVLTLRARERPGLRAFALAGLAAGLAASAKYNGLIAIVMPLLTAWVASGAAAVRVQRTVVILAAAGLGFLVGTPYAVLDLPAFLNDYARLAEIFARERGGEPGWSIYLKHLALALGRPAFYLALVGLAGALWRTVRGPGRLRWAQLAAFPVVYFHVMANSYQIYGRYLMPLLPFASLLAAASLTALLGVVGRLPMPALARRVAATVLVIVAIAPPARVAIDFNRSFGRQATVARPPAARTAWSVPPGNGSIRLPSDRRRPLAQQRRGVDVSPDRCVAGGSAFRLLPTECLAAGAQRLEDRVDVEDTAAPHAAAHVLQRRPEPGVVGQIGIGAEVVARRPRLEHTRRFVGGQATVGLAHEVQRAVERVAVDDDLDQVAVPQPADGTAGERFG